MNIVVTTRPNLCRACLRGDPCPRKLLNEPACSVLRNCFDAGYYTALSMMQGTIEHERRRKLQPPVPRKKSRRRR